MTDHDAPHDDAPGLLVAAVTILRRLEGNDLVDLVNAEDGDGNDLDLSTALGMMRLAEDTLIRVSMGEVDDDETP